MTSEERIELCLQRLSTGKASDVINFSYADALAYIERLKAENAALREKLSHSIELPCPFGTKVHAVFHFMTGNVTREGTFVGIRSGSTFDPNAEVLVAIVRIKTENGEYHDFNWRLDEFNNSWWADKEAALAENGYSQREIDELAKKVLIEHFSALGFSCVDDNSNHLTISWEEEKKMKSILMSIRPEWCKKIFECEKTIEVRKTRPLIDMPFKVFVYETKAQFVKSIRGACTTFGYGRGKVIGSFVCDDIISDWHGEHSDEFVKYALLSLDEQKKYGGNKPLYGWHITEPTLFDKPKELSEFTLAKGLCAGRSSPIRPPVSWCYIEGGDDE